MTSFIDRLKARMSGMPVQSAAANIPREKSRKVVLTNRWDDRVYTEARKTDKVDDLVADLSLGDEHKGGQRREFEAAPELVEGLFHSFYKAAPRLEHKRNLARELYPVRKILEEVQANPKLKELQEFTASDPVMSTVALDAMADQVREILSRIPPPPPPPQPKPQGKKKKPEGKEGDGDPNEGENPLPPGDMPGGHPGEGEGEGEGGGKPGKSGDQEAGEGDGSEYEDDLSGDGDSEFDPDAEDDEDQAEADWEAQWDDLLEDLDLDRLANKALDAAEKEASELDNLRKGIGLEDGDWQTMSPEERLAMAERLRTPEMRELASIIGRMKRFALGVKATRVNDVPHEAFDVEAGNDIRRVLKAEFALLATPATSYEFYRKYTDKELLQFKMRGTEEVGKGPIVMCIDKSGSMGGQPFHWALAVAEALRRFAQEEERDMYVLFFGNNNDRVRFDFPNGSAPFEKVLTFLGTVANGGTQFDGVLTEALDKASNAFDGDGKGKADIVFLTDGMAHLDDSWIEGFNKERERVGVRVYSVYIGGAYDMRYNGGPVGLLEKLSDAVIPVSDLKPEAVKDIFAKV